MSYNLGSTIIGGVNFLAKYFNCKFQQENELVNWCVVYSKLFSVKIYIHYKAYVNSPTLQAVLHNVISNAVGLI